MSTMYQVTRMIPIRHLVLWATLFAHIASTAFAQSPERRYACWGSFGPPVVSAQCPRNTVIQVTGAGLKVQSQNGLCAYNENDCGCEYGENGCQMPDVRKLCMGRPACRLDVTQQYISTSSCKGFSDYMFIEFNCVPVEDNGVVDICSNLKTRTDSGFVRSPNYPGISQAGRQCDCTLRTDPGSSIEITVIDFQTEETKCDHNKLVINYGSSSEAYCGKSSNMANRRIASNSNDINIRFDTDGNSVGGTFWLQYQAVPRADVRMKCTYKNVKSTIAPRKKTDVEDLTAKQKATFYTPRKQTVTNKDSKERLDVPWWLKKFKKSPLRTRSTVEGNQPSTPPPTSLDSTKSLRGFHPSISRGHRVTTPDGSKAHNTTDLRYHHHNHHNHNHHQQHPKLVQANTAGKSATSSMQSKKHPIHFTDSNSQLWSHLPRSLLHKLQFPLPLIRALEKELDPGTNKHPYARILPDLQRDKGAARALLLANRQIPREETRQRTQQKMYQSATSRKASGESTYGRYRPYQFTAQPSLIRSGNNYHKAYAAGRHSSPKVTPAAAGSSKLQKPYSFKFSQWTPSALSRIGVTARPPTIRHPVSTTPRRLTTAAFTPATSTAAPSVTTTAAAAQETTRAPNARREPSGKTVKTYKTPTSKEASQPQSWDEPLGIPSEHPEPKPYPKVRSKTFKPRGRGYQRGRRRFRSGSKMDDPEQNEQPKKKESKKNGPKRIWRERSDKTRVSIIRPEPRMYIPLRRAPKVRKIPKDKPRKEPETVKEKGEEMSTNVTKENTTPATTPRPQHDVTTESKVSARLLTDSVHSDDVVVEELAGKIKSVSDFYTALDKEDWTKWPAFEMVKNARDKETEVRTSTAAPTQTVKTLFTKSVSRPDHRLVKTATTPILSPKKMAVTQKQTWTPYKAKKIVYTPSTKPAIPTTPYALPTAQPALLANSLHNSISQMPKSTKGIPATSSRKGNDKGGRGHAGRSSYPPSRSESLKGQEDNTATIIAACVVGSILIVIILGIVIRFAINRKQDRNHSQTLSKRRRFSRQPVDNQFTGQKIPRPRRI